MNKLGCFFYWFWSFNFQIHPTCVWKLLFEFCVSGNKFELWIVWMLKHEIWINSIFFSSWNTGFSVKRESRVVCPNTFFSSFWMLLCCVCYWNNNINNILKGVFIFIPCHSQIFSVLDWRFHLKCIMFLAQQEHTHTQYLFNDLYIYFPNFPHFPINVQIIVWYSRRSTFCTCQ